MFLLSDILGDIPAFGYFMIFLYYGAPIIIIGLLTAILIKLNRNKTNKERKNSEIKKLIIKDIIITTLLFVAFIVLEQIFKQEEYKKAINIISYALLATIGLLQILTIILTLITKKKEKEILNEREDL